MTCVNNVFCTISCVIVQFVLTAKGLRTTNTVSCTATDMGYLGGLSLAPISSSIDCDIQAFRSNHPPYNGSRLNERRLPVWREEYRSFKKLLLQFQKAFCFLLFWILSRLFPSIFLNGSDTRRRNVRPICLWMCR